jgi:hypothetical protein
MELVPIYRHYSVSLKKNIYVYIHTYTHAPQTELKLLLTIQPNLHLNSKLSKHADTAFTASLHKIKVPRDYTRQWPDSYHQTSDNDETICKADGNSVQGGSSHVTGFSTLFRYSPRCEPW